MLNSVVPKASAHRLALVVGAAIFLVALLLRLIGIGWGLKNDLHNQSYHPDELPIFVASQQIEPARGQFVPGFYNYGTLYLTLLRITSDVVTSYTGAPEEHNQDSHWSWVSRCHLGGRVVSALAGAGTALVVFLIMHRRTSLFGAIMAGAVIAVAPGHVVHSRFQTVDIVAAFFIAASSWAALKLLPVEGEEVPSLQEKPAWGLKMAALAGAFAGLSAGTKYTGAVAILMLIAVVLIAKRPKWWLEGLVGVAAMAVAFLVTTPGAILDQAKFIADLKFESQHVASGHGLLFVDTGSGFAYHLANLSIGLGPLLAIVAGLAMIAALIRRQSWMFVLLAFFVVYFAVIAVAEVRFLRYSLPLYIALACAFGWAISQNWGRLATPIVLIVGVLALVGPTRGGFVETVRLTQSMSGEDPRDSAARYIRSIATATTRVGFGRDSWYWSVPLQKDSAIGPMLPIDTRLASLRTDTNPPVDFALTPEGTPTVFSPDLVEVLKPELIVYTSLEANDLIRLQGSKDLPADVRPQVETAGRFFEALKRRYKLDREFGAYTIPVEDMAYVCPQVSLWKRLPQP